VRLGRWSESRSYAFVDQRVVEKVEMGQRAHLDDRIGRDGDGAASMAAGRDELLVELLLTLRKAHEELGRWPTAGEWEASTSSRRKARYLPVPYQQGLPAGRAPWW
jgi:hypothetical protein